MIILMKCLNEQNTVARCIGDFHDEEWVDKIIVVDGGSTDFTVHELNKFSKVKTYIHPWLDWYHDMEVTQSNIVLSYLPLGHIGFILDFDERMSEELKESLSQIRKTNDMPYFADVCHFSRRTFDLHRHEDSPHAIIDEDTGWPHISHQIGQYPDYQCRLIRRTVEMKWANSPHHVMVGHKTQSFIQADILHFEKDDLRDRERIEIKWLRAQARRKELGLQADVFECSPKPELYKYSEPTYWEKK